MVEILGRSVFMGQIPRIEVLLKHRVLDPLCEDVMSGHLKDLYVLGTGS